MYAKLALRNVKKSYRDYFIYFLTLVIAVCLFYAFNSFQSQKAIMDLNDSQLGAMVALEEIMNYLSIFIAVVLGFLIIYANSFIVKRRKKEFATYMLLGMGKRNMSKILIYETLFVGLVSVGVGLILGIFASQALAAVSASLFDAPLNYKFIFSTSAFVLTLIAFIVIFAISMLFNTIVLNKYKLIDLLNADKKVDVIHSRNTFLYLIIFIIASCVLGYAYHLVLGDIFESIKNLPIAILCGCIGTVGIFLSLSGFLLKFTQLSKRVYFRNLNMFVLREVNASVKSNVVSMSIICILLLLSIGALSVGMTVRQQSNEKLKNNTPYDMSYVVSLKSDELPGSEEKLQVSDTYLPIGKEIDAQVSEVKEKREFTFYEVQIQSNEIKEIFNKSYGIESDTEMSSMFQFIKLSDYNQLMKDTGQKSLSLKDDEIALRINLKKMESAIKDANSRITIRGKEYHIKDVSLTTSTFYTTSDQGEGAIFVVPDNCIHDDDAVYSKMYNYNVKNIDDVKSSVLTDNMNVTYDGAYRFGGVTREYVYQTATTDSVLMTYVSIYLGFVLMLSSSVILALQQLSKANESKRRYRILDNIGVSRKMVTRAIILQLFIYFGLPLALAIVHSYVGITWIMNIIMMVTQIDLLEPMLITMSIILAIYGCYFIVTYRGYKNIVFKRR